MYADQEKHECLKSRMDVQEPQFRIIAYR